MKAPPTVFTARELVDIMRAQGIPLDIAEREARRAVGPAPATIDPAKAARDGAVREKAEQHAVVQRFAAVGGFSVYTLSQARATKQTPGLPDLWCMHPTHGAAPGGAFWWETKRQVGGKLSDDQLAFRVLAEACGVGYGSGDRYAATAWLVRHGFARVDGPTLEPARPQPRYLSAFHDGDAALLRDLRDLSRSLKVDQGRMADPELARIIATVEALRFPATPHSPEAFDS